MDQSDRSRRSTAALAEAALIMALVAAPLALGTVRLWSLAVVAALVGAAAIAGALARPRAVPWPALAAVGVALFAGLQAVPLPRVLLAWLSPHGLELLELSLGDVASHSLSLDPAGSARELGRLLSFALAMIVASRLASDERVARRLATVVAGLTVLQCLVIVGHKVVATTSIYGVFPTLQNNMVLGTFGNANLLAGYLTLGIPMLLALAASGRERGDTVAWLVAAAVAMVMVLLTGSRSGLVGMLVALATLGVALRARLRGVRRALGALGATLVIGGLLAAAFDRGRALKFASLLRPGHMAGDLKVQSWKDVPALIHDYWRTGVGRGAFETVFPGYKRLNVPVTFTHVENAPLQLLADFGVLVGSAVMVAWVAAIVLGMRRARAHGGDHDSDGKVLRLGAGAALAGITVHELGDFSLDVSGAVGLTVSVLFGLLWRARSLGTGDARSSASSQPSSASRAGAGDAAASRAAAAWRRPAVRVGAALTAVALIASGLTYAAHGEIAADVAAVQAAYSNPRAEMEALVRDAISRHPAEPWLPLIAGLDRVRHRKPQAALRDLNRAILLDPTSFRPHLAVAEALLQLGRPDQALLEFRLAYAGSGYSDVVAASMIAHREFADPAAPGAIERFGGSDVKVLTAYASFLDRAQRDDAAALAAGLLLALGPDDVAAHRLLARVEVRRKRFTAALAHARKLPSGDAEGLLAQLQSLDGLGRAAEADALLASVARTATTAEPLAAGTMMLLAERALQRGHADAALAALDRVAQDALGPEELGALLLLRSRALDAQGHMRDAIAAARSASRINPCETTWLALGSLYERAGLMREALLVYRGAMRSQPSPSAALRERRVRIERSVGIPAVIGGSAEQRDPSEAFGGGGRESANDEEDDDGDGESKPAPKQPEPEARTTPRRTESEE